MLSTSKSRFNLKAGNNSHANTHSSSTQHLNDTKSLSDGLRLFNKQSSRDLARNTNTEEEEEEEEEDDDDEDVPVGTRQERLELLRNQVRPCPYVKPLEHKMSARKEPSSFARPEIDPNSEAAISPITIARRRGETIRKLNGLASNEHSDQRVNGPQDKRATRARVTSAMEIAALVRAAEIEDLARLMAPDFSKQDMWSRYIRSYIGGHYNIISPPATPGLSSRYEYLPAILPHNEDRRLALSCQYNPLWHVWSSDRAGALLRAAMSKFKTPCASISIFSRTHEILKVEIGYSEVSINRQMSISAHVLYSSEVMVLLDACRDWRFARNPLVKGLPCIRFFAGAPLLSPEGLAVGVFAVWSKEKRESFTPDQRRELAELGSLVMTEMNTQLKQLSNPDRYAQYKPNRRDHSAQTTHQENLKLSLLDIRNDPECELDLEPPVLQSYRPTSPPPSAHYSISQALPPDSPPSHTPPPSRESDAYRANVDEGQIFYEDEKSNLVSDASYNGMPSLPTFHDLEESISRPFSSSDLTSLRLHPPNTPDRSLLADELSHNPSLDLNQFLATADTDEFDDSRDFSIDSAVEVNKLQPGSESLDTATDYQPSGETTDTYCKRAEASRNFDYDDSFSVMPSDPWGLEKTIKKIRDMEGESRFASGLRVMQKKLSQTFQRRQVLHSKVSQGFEQPALPEEESPGSYDEYVVQQQVSQSFHPQDFNLKTSHNVYNQRIVQQPASPNHERYVQNSRIYHDQNPSNKEAPQTSFAASRELRARVPPSEISTNIYNAISPTWEKSEAAKYAALACSAFAQKYDYDLIYVAELTPERLGMTDEALLRPGGLRSRILVAYGLTTPLDLRPETHLWALRTRGGMTWPHNGDDQNYQHGSLISIFPNTSVPINVRDSGFVMGVFSWKTRSMGFCADEETRTLLQFSQELKSIILQKPARKPVLKSMIEPASAPSSPYPANEATQFQLEGDSYHMGKHSLDSHQLQARRYK